MVKALACCRGCVDIGNSIALVSRWAHREMSPSQKPGVYRLVKLRKMGRDQAASLRESEHAAEPLEDA